MLDWSSRVGAPTMTSEKPLPSRSPPVPTENPYDADVCSPSPVHEGVAASPAAEPWYVNAFPSSIWPLLKKGAPMTTSENPSPFTSPAVPTEYPNWAPTWFDSAVHAGEDPRPLGEPR